MNDKKHYLGHRKRLKEKFLNAKENLPDYELLELILGYAIPRKDTKPIAKKLLKKFGSLKGVLTARSSELEEIEGVGEGIVLFFKVLQEFWSRIERDKVFEKEVITSPYDVFKFMKPRVGFSSKESFWIILLDNKNRIIKEKELFKGTVDHAAVYIREIFSTILKFDASGIILIHNHPGGDPAPSIYDRELTRKISRICKDLDIRLLDHVIIAEDKYYSFKEKEEI